MGANTNCRKVDNDLDTIRQVIQNSGVDVIETRNDLTGSQYTKDGEWIAIVATQNVLARRRHSGFVVVVALI